MPEQRDGWTRAEVISKIVSAVFLPIVLLVLGTWFSRQQKQSEEMRSLAESNANRLTTLLKSLSSDNPRERLLATKVTEYFGAHNQLPNELVPALLEISATDPSKDVSDSAFRSLAATAQANQTLAPTIATALRTLPARVYIQIASPAQRDKARQIQQKLIDAGFVVPGIEDISGKADIPRATSVRYFNDEDKANAEKIVEILRTNSSNSPFAYRVSNLHARPGTLEIWFSRNE
jgi:hypothetical protein